MNHLTDTEFVDLIEDAGPAAADRRRHAAACEACRAQAAALGAVLAQTASDEMPEPSPLFWDHFSRARPRGGRGESPAPRRRRGCSGSAARWRHGPRRPSIAVLIMLTVVWRATLPTRPAETRGRRRPTRVQAPRGR